MIDTHAHLNDRVFTNDLHGVLERAAAAGVENIVCVGTDLPSSRAAIALAENHRHIWATVGIHPNDAADLYPADVEELRDLARHPRVAAIGETGLDFFRNRSSREAQVAAFRLHLDLARESSLPVVVHDRDAHDEVMQELRRWVMRQYGERFGVLHCFSGSLSMALEAIELGFYVAVGGPVTYADSGALADVVRGVPLERLLLETDCPYLTPEPYRGRRNEPAHVALVNAAVARLRREPPEEVAAVTTANALHLFGGPF